MSTATATEATMNASTRTIITCNCSACGGRKADVPAGMLKGATAGSKRHATVVHNLVSVAHSPLGGGPVRKVA